MEEKFSNARKNFLQRRYGVSLGRRYVLAAAGVVLVSVLGCSQVSTNMSAFALSPLPESESPISKRKLNPETKLVNAHTKFGFKLFSEILKQDKNNNVFISVPGVAFALAMTYNGASGSTQEAMAQALELQDMSLDVINSSNASLKALLENPDSEVQLTVANSLWANKDVSFKQEFLRKSQDFYQAKVTNLNFGDASVPSVINKWVNQNTHGKINHIVETIKPDQMLLLLNAIYFKGSWTDQFDKQKTADYSFKLASGKVKQHPMMSQTGNYRYYENGQFQAVSLPYGQDGKVSFYVFLPTQNSNLKTFYQSLNEENWEKWMTQFQRREGFVRLPRLKMDYDITLNDALTALGMGEAFSNKANFSGMGKDLKISEVKQKTFVEVNEEGTEAAAATSVKIVPLSAPVRTQKPFTMIVDHPFFCAIRDNQTGSILFMGSIVEPT
jgi:serine protease inhibitor